MHSNERILYIYEWLLHETDNMHSLSATQIVQRFSKMGQSVHRTTVYRYIEALSNFLFIRKNGNGFYVASRTHTVGEVSFLCDAVKASKSLTPRKKRDLIVKLYSLLSVYDREKISMTPDDGMHDLFENIEVFRSAIQIGQKAEFDYTYATLQEKPARRHIVSPYGLVWHDDKYYLVANIDGKPELTHFRADKIKNSKIVDEPSIPIAKITGESNFNITKYVSQNIKMYSGKSNRVKLLCDNSIYSKMIDDFGNDIKIRKRDGCFELLIDVAINEGLLSYIASFGNKMQVLSPDELKEQTIDFLSRAQSAYK